MYKVLLADDEGIMLESLKTIIESQYAGECEIETAKTGWSAVELAESFRPDIAFMDIQMPGINGIEAMREMRKFNSSACFIIITAYDKFDYAKEAINLGAVEYLTKPVRRQVILNVLMKAMKRVDMERKKRSDQLKIREKLETVIPIIESGFINSLLLQDGGGQGLEHYIELLDIHKNCGFIIILQFGEPDGGQEMTNMVGMSVKAQAFYGKLRDTIKEFFHCIIGPVMANKVIMFVPWEHSQIEYEERKQIIERIHSMVERLGERIDAKFRTGIGMPVSFEEIKESYKQALQALNEARSSVCHIKDLPAGGEYVGEYPSDLEKQMFQAISRIDQSGAVNAASAFFDWMVRNYPESRDDIRIKVLEFVMLAEKEAFISGGMTYGFHYRQNYLSDVLGMEDYGQLRRWFLEKIGEVCRQMATRKEEQSESIVTRAKNFIDQNYNRDLSLDDVSKSVDISPYYFSKLFKDETGDNFIEYLTGIRIEKAKELLKNRELSIKEICISSGYADPNYFSRIFKKCVEMTPSEYRERLNDE